MNNLTLVGGDQEAAQRGIDLVHREPLIGPRKMGILLFLGSETILFLTVIGQYVVGQGHNTGPTPQQSLDVLKTLGFSVALWASSATVQLAPLAVQRGRQGLMRLWLLATVVLGAVFLYGEASEWLGLANKHITASTNIWATTFFTLTGIHGLHVILGLTLLTGQIIFSYIKPVVPGNDSGLEIITIYWHFVDAMWVLIFSTIYLWSAFLGG
ncbi:MAG: cytochrome c oxidase subunit 3 [Chloroflexota bacterium]